MLSTYAQNRRKTEELQQLHQPRLPERPRLRRAPERPRPRRPRQRVRVRPLRLLWLRRLQRRRVEVKTAVVMEELEAMEELETTEKWQEENLLVRSSAGGVAKGTVPWPPTQLILASRQMHFRRLRMTLTILMILTRVHVFLIAGPRMIIWPAQALFAIDRSTIPLETKENKLTRD